MDFSFQSLCQTLGIHELQDILGFTSWMELREGIDYKHSNYECDKEGGDHKPYYFPNEMDSHHGLANPHQSIQQVAGEFMKAGVVTKSDGSGPPLHSHPNEEQFTYMLTGELKYIWEKRNASSKPAI